eukprot:TRINITY_DN8972_c2_g2_i5.p1 TRINITY_DN8972_c2_g2~~TRINITY_DN8972_c2_g2_i5.p1  ORF type:complete len:203 (-),score=16.83 TRINITY_DN8972_c2_g2_i5:114-722(-)
MGCRCPCLSSKNHNQSHLRRRYSWLEKQCRPLLQHHNHSHSRIHHLPQYGRQAPSHSILYKHLKLEALSEERILRGPLEGSTEWKSILWDIVGRIKWLGFGIFLLFAVNYSIFPGYLTEDMHSQKLKDWYPIILIFACNVFDLVGKSLSALYLVENANVMPQFRISKLPLRYPKLARHFTENPRTFKIIVCGEVNFLELLEQ